MSEPDAASARRLETRASVPVSSVATGQSAAIERSSRPEPCSRGQCSGSSAAYAGSPTSSAGRARTAARARARSRSSANSSAEGTYAMVKRSASQRPRASRSASSGPPPKRSGEHTTRRFTPASAGSSGSNHVRSMRSAMRSTVPSSGTRLGHVEAARSSFHSAERALVLPSAAPSSRRRIQRTGPRARTTHAHSGSRPANTVAGERTHATMASSSSSAARTRADTPRHGSTRDVSVPSRRRVSERLEPRASCSNASSPRPASARAMASSR